MVNCCAMKPSIENPRASSFLIPRGVDEGSCVLRHLFNRSRNFTARTGEAGVVEQDHFAVLGKSVGQCGIPVIHGSGKVHEEEQRDVDRYAEAAVGDATVREANPSRLNELGRRGLVRVVTHKKSPSGGGPRISPRSSPHPLGWRHQSCTTHWPKRERRSHERSPLVLRDVSLARSRRAPLYFYLYW